MTLEHKISQKALELVKSLGADNASEYRSFCEGFPALLRSAGLAQTVAFLSAKAGHPHGDLYRHIEEQFRGLDVIKDKNTSLLELVAGSGAAQVQQYRLYSQLALRIAYWHKRLAQSMIAKKPQPK